MNTKRQFIGLKDVVLITLLTALCLVICTIVVLPFSTNVKLVLWVVTGLEMLLCGPIFVRMCAKAPRRGTAVLFAFIFAVYYYFTNSMIIISLTLLAVGVVMELVLLGDGYKKPVRLTISYALFGLGVMLTPPILILVQKTSMVEMMLSNGLTQDYIDAMFAVYSGANLTIGILVTVVGSAIGCFIGYRLLKKHFAPAGIVDENA